MGTTPAGQDFLACSGATANQAEGEAFFPSMEVALSESLSESTAPPDDAPAITATHQEAVEPDPKWTSKVDWTNTQTMLLRIQRHHAVNPQALQAAATRDPDALADCLDAVAPANQESATPLTSESPESDSAQADSDDAESDQPSAPEGSVSVVEMAVPETKPKDWIVGATAGDWPSGEREGSDNGSQGGVLRQPADFRTTSAVSAELEAEGSPLPADREKQDRLAIPDQAATPNGTQSGGDQIDPRRVIATGANQSAPLRTLRADDRLKSPQIYVSADPAAADPSADELPPAFEALVHEQPPSSTLEHPVTPSAPQAAAPSRHDSPGLPVRRPGSAVEDQASERHLHVEKGEGGGLDADTPRDSERAGKALSEFASGSEDKPLLVSAQPGTGASRESGPPPSWPSPSAEIQSGDSPSDRTPDAPAEVRETQHTEIAGELDKAESGSVLREVHLDVQSESGATVHLKFTERRGEVHVVSRTSDTVLGRDLAEGLPDLKLNFEDSGMEADVWSSQGERLAVEKEVKAETRSGPGPDGRSAQWTGRDSQGGSRSGGGASKWIDTIEDSLDEGRNGGKR